MSCGLILFHHFFPEGQFGRGIGGLLRTILKPAEPELKSITLEALGSLGNTAVNNGKRKAANYAFGKLFGVDSDRMRKGRKRRRVQKGSGIKGRKKARRRADIFTY